MKEEKWEITELPKGLREHRLKLVDSLGRQVVFLVIEENSNPIISEKIYCNGGGWDINYSRSTWEPVERLPGENFEQFKQRLEKYDSY